MQKLTYIIRDKNGIHARPAGLIVQVARQYESNLAMKNGEKSADCKKLFQVMQLGVKAGDEVEISADGRDENEAISELGDAMRGAGL